MGKDELDAAERAKQGIAGAFDRASEEYDQVGPRFFAPFGRRLVEVAGIPPGARVLDVACGRGALLFPAAEQAGPDGRVTGIDLAEGMVRRTAAEAAQRGLGNVSLELMDAERLTFADASFDVVVCGFGIFFCPHPHAALAEFARVLAPGGRLALSTWSNPDPRWVWLFDVLGAHLPPETDDDEKPAQDAVETAVETAADSAADASQAPNYRDPASLRSFLQGAGFQDINTERYAREIVFTDEAEWWRVGWSHGARHELEIMRDTGGPAALARYQAEVEGHMQPMREADGFHEIQAALLTVGTKGRA